MYKFFKRIFCKHDYEYEWSHIQYLDDIVVIEDPYDETLIKAFDKTNSQENKEMKFKDFEIRKPTLLQEPCEDYYKYNFDLVKWDDDKDGTKYCYSIAFLRWDPKEFAFKFESVGTRYLEYREDGLEQWLLQWCKLKEVEFIFEKEAD